MPVNFLDQLLANPHGFGYGPAYPTAPEITYDEYGQPHDVHGNKIQPPADPSLADSLWNIGESPARLTTALASGFSPYGQDGWQVPPLIQEPINALMRLGQNSRFDDGRLGIPNPENLDNQHDTATLIESLFGGNATRGVGAGEAVAARALSDTGKPSVLGSAMAGAEHNLPMDQASRLARAHEQGFTIAAHRGLSRPYSDAHAADNIQMFSSDPAIAASYADGAAGNVLDARLRMRNPLVIDAQGAGNYSLRPEYLTPEARAALRIPEDARYLSTDDILHYAGNADYDGIHFQNIRDDFGGTGNPSDVYAIFDPSNIRSRDAAFDPARTNDIGLLFSDTGKPSILGAAVAGAEGNAPLKGYRGASSADNLIHGDQVWGSSRPDVASSYAHAPDYNTTRTPVVAPMDFHFQNPMEVDAGGNLWHSLPQSLAPEAKSDPFRFPDRFRPDLLTTDDLAELAKAKGHDGLVVRNVMDSLFADNAMPMSQPAGVSDVYAALKRGTVKSPLTGETLFSDGTPSLWGSAVSQDQDRPRNSLFTY